ncbi:MAG: endonuclease III [Candidatus Thermoplasmatota archaeon]
MNGSLRSTTKKYKSIDFDRIFKLIKETLYEIDQPPVPPREEDDIPLTPFTTLITCLLSLRTKDEITEQAAKRLLRGYNTPESIIQLPEEKIASLIYPVGFYKTKAKRIKEISKTLVDKYQGVVPEDFNELLKLKGVGRKTANIVMTYGFKKPGYIAIDTHCHRIPNRLGWIKTKTPEETEKEIKRILPEKHWYDFNHLFVRFGQRICTPISPFCSRCPIEQYCEKILVGKRR